MLVTTRKILQDAQRGGYGVGAFNAENAEMVFAIAAAAQRKNAPVIIQTTPSTLRYLPPSCFCGMVRAAAEGVSVPVALHLDHGLGYEQAEECIRAGYTSVMVDYSQREYEENVALTRKAVEFALHRGIPVEAELGKIGGKEDQLEGGDGEYTDPGQAADFVLRTGVASLAVAVGTAHGIYTVPPVLDLERIDLIRQRVTVPLVMHGASGLSDSVVQRAVEKGICKVNFATELRRAFSGGVRKALGESPDAYDPKKYLSAGMAEVQRVAEEKIAVCGSSGMAR